MKQPELGRKILELRKQKGFTQEELVEQCNVNVRTIQRIEAGEVMPRSFTLKVILNALGEDFDILKDEKSNSFELENIQVYTSQIKLAWICGLIYFLSGFVEFAVDYARFYEDKLIVSNTLYIIIKSIVLFTFVFFMRGFVFTGNIYGNYLLKIGAYMLIGIIVLFCGYDIASLYSEGFYIEYVLITQSIFFGIGGFIFGFALIKWNDSMGVIPKIAGGLQIAASVMFILVFMAWLGYIFILPAVLLQIILLFKIEDLLKRKKKVNT